MGSPRVQSSHRVSHILLLRASLVYPPLFSLYYSSKEKFSPSAESHSHALVYCSREQGAWTSENTLLAQADRAFGCMHASPILGFPGFFWITSLLYNTDAGVE